MAEEIWEKQRREKYRDHDFVLEDVRGVEIENMRSQAVKAYAETRESDNLKIIVKTFMGFLTANGYRIVKKESK